MNLKSYPEAFVQLGISDRVWLLALYENLTGLDKLNHVTKKSQNLEKEFEI